MRSYASDLYYREPWIWESPVFGTYISPSAFLSFVEEPAEPTLGAEWRTALLGVAEVCTCATSGWAAPAPGDLTAGWASRRDLWRAPMRDVDEIPWGVRPDPWRLDTMERRS